MRLLCFHYVAFDTLSMFMYNETSHEKMASTEVVLLCIFCSLNIIDRSVNGNSLSNVHSFNNAHLLNNVFETESAHVIRKRDVSDSKCLSQEQSFLQDIGTASNNTFSNLVS